MKFNKITPNLMVADVWRSVAFYRDVCGFSVIMALRDDGQTVDASLVDGAVYAFVILTRDSVELMVQEEASLRGDLPASAKTRPAGLSCTYYVEVESVDALYARMQSMAPDVLRAPPKTSWYGMREFFAEDCDGHLLMFAERQQAPVPSRT